MRTWKAETSNGYKAKDQDEKVLHGPSFFSREDYSAYNERKETQMANIMNTKVSDLTVKQNLGITAVVALGTMALFLVPTYISEWKYDREFKKDQES